MSDLLNRIKTYFADWQDKIKSVSGGVKDTKAALQDVQAEMPVVQKFVADVQVQVEKMNFKNKPRLERIAEAQERIKQALSK